MPSIQKPPTVNDDVRARGIYRQAARIIYEKGFEATSMGDIAEAVDLTKGGLYYYIKGKKALLFAIMNFAMNLIQTEVMEPALEEEDPERRLAALVAGHIHLVIQDPCAMHILVAEDEGLDQRHREAIDERKQQYPELLRESIEQVLAEREDPRDIDPTVAAYGLLGTIQWVVRWYREDGRLSTDEVVEQLTQLALHGLISEA